MKKPEHRTPINREQASNIEHRTLNGMPPGTCLVQSSKFPAYWRGLAAIGGGKVQGSRFFTQ
jgi:hypothetical protein